MKKARDVKYLRKLTNHMRTVIFIIGLANLALKTSLDLSSDTNAITNLAGGDFVASLDYFANNLMTNTDWQGTIAPAAINCMDVGAANAASFNLDVNIMVLEWLWLELR